MVKNDIKKVKKKTTIQKNGGEMEKNLIIKACTFPRQKLPISLARMEYQGIKTSLHRAL